MKRVISSILLFGIAFVAHSQVVRDTNTSSYVPPVVMSDVSISKAIEVLARVAGINYLIDYRLANWWATPDVSGQATHEPTVSFRWNNLTAKEALLRMLAEHRLVLLEDPLTTIARVTYTNQTIPAVDLTSLGDTNEASSFATNLVPLVFQDVPITTALETLARLAGINYMLAPEIGYGKPDKYGEIKPEPVLSVRWENVTYKQAFVAICENYGFRIVNDPTSGVAFITIKNHPLVDAVDLKSLGDTNEEAELKAKQFPIVFQDVPITMALDTLARLAGIKYRLAPEIGYNKPDKNGEIKPEPTLSVRWVNVTYKQAFVAICENYGFRIVNDSTSGVVQIEPRNKQ
jgi:hypothetical protein